MEKSLNEELEKVGRVSQLEKDLLDLTLRFWLAVGIFLKIYEHFLSKFYSARDEYFMKE